MGISLVPPEPHRSVDEANEVYEDLCEALDEIEDSGNVSAMDFVEDVGTKADEMFEQIERKGSCSPAQYRTLENWLEGARKWTSR